MGTNYGITYTYYLTNTWDDAAPFIFIWYPEINLAATTSSGESIDGKTIDRDTVVSLQILTPKVGWAKIATAKIVITTPTGEKIPTPIGTRYLGESFVVTGRTNLAPQDKLLVEVVPASFVPSGKNDPVSSYGTSGSVAVVKGSPDNSWSFSVDGSKLSADTYTMKVSGVSVSTSSSATFDVIPKPTETPTPEPTETTPVTTVPTRSAGTNRVSVGRVLVGGTDCLRCGDAWNTAQIKIKKIFLFRSLPAPHQGRR